MQGIKDYLHPKEDVQSVIEGFQSGMKEQMVAGLSGASRSLMISLLQESLDRPVILVTHQLIQAQQLYEDMQELADPDQVHLYPVNELIASEIAVASPELRSQRIEALSPVAFTGKRCVDRTCSCFKAHDAAAILLGA